MVQLLLALEEEDVSNLNGICLALSAYLGELVGAGGKE